MISLIKDSIRVTILSFIVSLSVYFVFAQTVSWTGPTSGPPAGNVTAPLRLDTQGNLNVPGNLAVNGANGISVNKLNYQGIDVRFSQQSILTLTNQINTGWSGLGWADGSWSSGGMVIYPTNWTYTSFPGETCDGRVMPCANSGCYSCPSTYNGNSFQCNDIAESSNTYNITSHYFWQRTVTCNYSPKLGPVELVP